MAAGSVDMQGDCKCERKWAGTGAAKRSANLKVRLGCKVFHRGVDKAVDKEG